ncbi:oxidoreductase (aldo-keto reductase family protein) [Halodesulfurarchaeum formicicum]|uniref:Oxidoreductase (Aldo-keto reductase family protein) n=2 Tax=Halodesulfurarchaeum formicicum TaxID=1873524 RepID=A0A1J1ACG4_9EURY|nr:aldo/keto reductase [Halodesulfurarchaeum formicicum]APE95448.1 oxidoreductase (aldo-keto reductase family protein) [Halodesulfurarchaeum formicicum]
MTAPATVNGMPRLGIGTWENTDPDECTNAVKTALEMGYRHVDTAQIYGNEAEVGRGIAQADVDRESIFLATKVWIDSLEPEAVRTTTEESLEKLGVDYVDLLYVHWPADTYDPKETLPAFQQLVEDGLTERIGVSNFEPEHLETASSVLGADPFANQVEMHPLLPQAELREAVAEMDTEIVAYSPLARGAVFDVPEITAVADKHDVSEAQVSLAWLREKGVTAIPKATSEDHIADNWASRTLELDADDIEKIDGIDRTDRQVDPDFAPW